MRALLVAALLLFVPSLASAVSYNGQVSESGVPVNGTRYFTLTVYDASIGGAVLHTQAESLKVVGGVFHTKLTAPDSVWYQAGRWIGVSVDGGAEFLPRKEIDHILRPSPILVVRPSKNAIVPSSWTIVDTVTIITPTTGMMSISATGFGLWAGPMTQSSAELAISDVTPAEPMTVLRAISASEGFSMTITVPVTAGPRTYYVWARNVVSGGTYSINLKRFQALFIPN